MRRSSSRSVVALCCLGLAWPAMQGCDAHAAAPLPKVSAPAFELAETSEADALHCLIVGAMTPPLERLDDDELAATIRLLGGVMTTYEHADFGLFLAMRRRDRDVAPDPERTAELVGLLDELGVRTPPAGWVELLGAFWTRYYDVAPVRRFVPEATRARLERRTLTLDDLDAWDRDFDALAAGRPFITHVLSLPHRRAPLGAGRASAAVAWIDFDLAFEGDRGLGGRLWLRFVWDDEDRDWFLHRALSAFDVGSDPAPKVRNLIL
ncbi:MAG: hypothetical protein K8S98_17855 [Planctomycetes bacterium]|nr:hypothetical protein [Planctomycetota bacterium]